MHIGQRTLKISQRLVVDRDFSTINPASIFLEMKYSFSHVFDGLLSNTLMIHVWLNKC